MWVLLDPFKNIKLRSVYYSLLPIDERRAKTTGTIYPETKIRYGYVNINKRKDLLSLYLSTAQTKEENLE